MNTAVHTALLIGDTLFTIAAAHRVHEGWLARYRANRHTISNPAAIKPGQVLRLR